MEAGRIYQAIPAIMGEINAIGKNKQNKTQGFMYRGIDDVMNTINPALVKNKVFIVPEILEQAREERTTVKGANLIYSICKMRFKFFAEDGSSVEAVTIGEGMDSGDKATNKAMAIAFKYACFQIFCIPTEDMKDSDDESHKVIPKEESYNHKFNSQKQQENKSNEQKNVEMIEQGKKVVIDALKIKVIKEKIQEKGLSECSILEHYKHDSFEEMIMEEWTNAMQLLERYPDKEGKQ